VSWRFAPDTAVNLAVNIVIVSFLAFFEEIGWRGYMLAEAGNAVPTAGILGVLAGAAVAENPTLAAYLTGETGNIYPARNRDRCLGAGQAPGNRSRTPPCCAGVI
jgi:membrane protease YdiL (CAAX protease family)